MTDLFMQGFDNDFSASNAQPSHSATFTQFSDGNIEQRPQNITSSSMSSPRMPSLTEDPLYASSTRCENTATSPLPEIADPIPVAKGSDSNPWPFEWYATKEDQKIVLPELRLFQAQRARNTTRANSQTSQHNLQLFSAPGALDKAKRFNIIKLLTLPLTQIPWQEDVSILRTLPSPEVLHHLIDLYFLHFHEASGLR